MSSTWWVVPFGNPGVKGHLHLTRAYRSLSRPSSPVRAKASAMRPLLLSRTKNLVEYTFSIYLAICLLYFRFHRSLSLQHVKDLFGSMDFVNCQLSILN